MTTKNQESQKFFIEHLKYLLSLKDDTRNRRQDWKQMKKLLKIHDYILYKYSMTPYERQKRRLLMRMININKKKPVIAVEKTDQSDLDY